MEEDWSIWKTLEERKEEVGEGVNIWDSIKDKLDISKKKPERIENFEVQEFERREQKYYVLKNLENGKLLQMSEEEYFVWEKLNGESTIRDIALAYFLTFNSMGFANIGMLINALASKGFLKEKSINTLMILRRHFVKEKLKYRIMIALYKLWNVNFQIKDVDSKMKSLYKKFVWIIYTKPFIMFSLVVSLIGSLLFFKTLQLAPASFSDLSLNALVGVYLFVTVCTIFHELAHGFTTTHYGREVGGFGLMLYYGGIAAFCDTTDIWMAPRSARFFVSFVGPYTNFFLGSVIGIFAYFSLENALLASILVKSAFVNYLLSALNLNPLLEWDGYYMLMDYLQIPNMRKKSFKFLKKKFISKVRGFEKFNSEERVFALYGIGAFVYTAIILLIIPLRFFNFIKSAL